MRGVSLEPRWLLSPYIAIWAVCSKTSPDRIGWWAISGDLPTDYIANSHERDDGDVLLSFSCTWRKLAADMAAGIPRPDYQIGPPGREKEFAPMLLARAEMLEHFAKDMKRAAHDY